ncbi:MAG: alpha/beta hydrolase [Rhodobacteraceae bacterium]|nr:alpha/beta hydrolase [Paracoccaceae bacterium]
MTLTRTDLPVEPQDRAVIEQLLVAARAGTAYRVTGDAQAMRAATERLLAMPIMARGDPSVTVTPGAVGGIDGEWLAPAQIRHRAVLVFLHGGGYVRGSLALGRSNATELAARIGARVFAPAYRQGPEDPFPAAFDDVVAVSRALAATGAPYVLVGESAGGGLAVAAAMGLRAAGDALPVAVSGISPFLDLTLSGDSWVFNADKDMATRAMGEDMIALYMQGGDRRDWRASPLFGPFEGLPPLHIALGGHEGLYSEVLDLAQRAAEAGVRVYLDVFEGMPHGFSKYTLSSATRALARISAWIDGELARADA